MSEHAGGTGERGGPAPAGGPGEPGGPAPAPALPHQLFPLAMLVVLEPPLLILLWAINPDLADGHLIAIALLGGLFVTLPSLAIFGLAVIWERRLNRAGTVPGLPPALTGSRASRVSGIALVVSTVLFGAVIALLLGAWALVALPPLALSLASAWLMIRAA